MRQVCTHNLIPGTCHRAQISHRCWTSSQVVMLTQQASHQPDSSSSPCGAWSPCGTCFFQMFLMQSRTEARGVLPAYQVQKGRLDSSWLTTWLFLPSPRPSPTCIAKPQKTSQLFSESRWGHSSLCSLYWPWRPQQAATTSFLGYMDIPAPFVRGWLNWQFGWAKAEGTLWWLAGKLIKKKKITK